MKKEVPVHPDPEQKECEDSEKNGGKDRPTEDEDAIITENDPPVNRLYSKKVLIDPAIIRDEESKSSYRDQYKSESMLLQEEGVTDFGQYEKEDKEDVTNVSDKYIEMIPGLGAKQASEVIIEVSSYADSPIKTKNKKSDARDAKLDIEDYLNMHAIDDGADIPLNDLQNVRSGIEQIRKSVDSQSMHYSRSP